MCGFHTVCCKGKREVDRLVGCGAVCLKGKGCGCWLLRVVAIACLWFLSCWMLHLHNSLSCEGKIISTAKGTSERVIMQVGGSVL